MNELSIAAIIIATLALITSMIGTIMVLAIKWSTHKIEWKPLEVNDPFKSYDELTEEVEDTSTEEAVKMSREAYAKRKQKEEKDPLDEILQSTNF